MWGKAFGHSSHTKPQSAASSQDSGGTGAAKQKPQAGASTAHGRALGSSCHLPAAAWSFLSLELPSVRGLCLVAFFFFLAVRIFCYVAFSVRQAGHPCFSCARDALIQVSINLPINLQGQFPPSPYKS